MSAMMENCHQGWQHRSMLFTPKKYGRDYIFALAIGAYAMSLAFRICAVGFSFSRFDNLVRQNIRSSRVLRGHADNGRGGKILLEDRVGDERG
jgi:hypothetical protein